MSTNTKLILICVIGGISPALASFGARKGFTSLLFLELRMVPQQGSGCGGERGAGVEGFAQGFGAMGPPGAREPAVVQGFADQVEGIRGDGGLFFQAGGMANANKETGQEQGRAQQGAARIGGDRTGTPGLERARQILKHGEGPHGGVFRGRKGIVKNGMRRRNGSPTPAKPRGKIAELKLPVHLKRAVAEAGLFGKEQFAQPIFITGNIAQGAGIFEGEFKGSGCIIEADEAELAGNIGGGAEDGDGIGGSAEADVPDDEFAGGLCEAFTNAKLADVKKVGLGARAKPGMHFFAVAGGKEGALAVRESYELVVIGHAGIVWECHAGC